MILGGCWTALTMNGFFQVVHRKSFSHTFELPRSPLAFHFLPFLQFPGKLIRYSSWKINKQFWIQVLVTKLLHFQVTSYFCFPFCMQIYHNFITLTIQSIHTYLKDFWNFQHPYMVYIGHNTCTICSNFSDNHTWSFISFWWHFIM